MKSALRGSVYVDGELVYEGLFPSISHDQGLVVYRKAIDVSSELRTVPDGPHIYFPLFHPYFITTIHSLEEMRANPRYRFNGPNLGGISKSGGYLHGDSLIRRIQAIDLSLTYASNSVRVDFEGIAGPVLSGNGSSPKASLKFSLWFELPVARTLEFSPHCGAQGMESLAHKLKQM